MNAAHLHLLLNHIPAIGMLFGLIIFLVGLIAKNKSFIQVALALLIVAWLFAIPTFASGEGAEEILEKNQPEISHKVIHEHEEEAEKAIIFIHITGILAAVSLYLDLKHYSKIKWFYWATLLMTIITFTLLLQVNNSGGKIRHTEIHQK